METTRCNFLKTTRGFAKEWFPKGWFGGCSPVPKTGTRVRSHLPPERQPEQGYVHMFPRTANRNEGTFTKPLARVPLQNLVVKFFPEISSVPVSCKANNRAKTNGGWETYHRWGGVQNHFWEGVLWYVSPLLSFPPPFVFLFQARKRARTHRGIAIEMRGILRSFSKMLGVRGQCLSGADATALLLWRSRV